MIFDGTPIGNRNPKKRGLDKEIKNKKKGCGVKIVHAAIILTMTPTAGWFLAERLFG